MALATTLTPLTTRPDTLSNAYKVALCVRAQGRTSAGAMTLSTPKNIVERPTPTAGVHYAMNANEGSFSAVPDGA